MCACACLALHGYGAAELFNFFAHYRQAETSPRNVRDDGLVDMPETKMSCNVS